MCPVVRLRGWIETLNPLLYELFFELNDRDEKYAEVL